MPICHALFFGGGLKNILFPLSFRAGYLTLFGGEQNNNCADAANVYSEYHKFDGLLIKMARSTLKSGQLNTTLSVILKCLYADNVRLFCKFVCLFVGLW